MQQQLSHTLKQLRHQAPLVLNLTNAVTTDFIANGLLCAGASPIMGQSTQEIVELVQLSSVLMVNLGTLHQEFLDLVDAACQAAAEANKPIVLDPVGAGATAYRTRSALSLLKSYPISILRGNASEILALTQPSFSHSTKGVDSTVGSEEVVELAQTLAQTYQTVLCISGQTDYIINSQQVEQLRHGSALMPKVTGTGCLLTAIIAAFHAIEKNAFQASLLATYYYTLCGERAGTQSHAPGSFKMNFLDALYEFK